MELFTPSEAASMLFEQYGDEVYRYIRFTINDATEADDLLQEVFLRVLQSWKRFRRRSNSKTWLWSITNNCIRDYLRRQKRHSIQVSLDTEIADTPELNAEFEIWFEQRLQNLTVPQRQVFIERIIHEESTEETAIVLGWSTSKVKTTLYRAIKAIKDSLREGDDRNE